MNVVISTVIRELSKGGSAFLHYQAPQLRGFACLLSGVSSVVMQPSLPLLNWVSARNLLLRLGAA